MNLDFDRRLLFEFDRIKERDEQILWAAKPKFIAFMLPIIPFEIVFIAGAIFQLCGLFEFKGNIPSVVLDILFTINPYLLFFFWRLLYSNILYGYSDKRVFIRMGFQKINFKTIPYDEIVAFDVEERWIDKPLHVGAVRFHTGETREVQGKTEKIYYYWRTIENPHEVFEKMEPKMQKNTKA